MPTKDQYEAAAHALHDLAEKKIRLLNFFMQQPERAALNDELMHEFAHAALDAALKDTK